MYSGRSVDAKLYFRREKGEKQNRFQVFALTKILTESSESYKVFFLMDF